VSLSVHFIAGEMSLRYPLNYRLGGPQSWSRHFGGIHFTGRLVSSIVTVLTELWPHFRICFLFAKPVLCLIMFPSSPWSVQLTGGHFQFQANRTAVLVHKLITKTRDPGLREEVCVCVPVLSDMRTT
jgi:hypothetical protein